MMKATLEELSSFADTQVTQRREAGEMYPSRQPVTDHRTCGRHPSRPIHPVLPLSDYLGPDGSWTRDDDPRRSYSCIRALAGSGNFSLGRRREVCAFMWRSYSSRAMEASYELSGLETDELQGRHEVLWRSPRWNSLRYPRRGRAASSVSTRVYDLPIAVERALPVRGKGHRHRSRDQAMFPTFVAEPGIRSGESV